MSVKSLESRVKSQKPLAALRSHSGSRLLTLDSRPSRGMTLIELLVVIVILSTIVGAAIPLLSPSNDDRRLREAARGLNTYITVRKREPSRRSGPTASRSSGFRRTRNGPTTMACAWRFITFSNSHRTPGSTLTREPPWPSIRTRLIGKAMYSFAS